MIWSRSSLCENTRSIQNRIISPFKKAQICLTQLLHNIWNLMIFYCIICEYAALSYFDYCCLTWPHTSLVLRIELIDGIGGPLNHSLISPPSRENGSPHEGPPPNTIKYHTARCVPAYGASVYFGGLLFFGPFSLFLQPRGRPLDDDKWDNWDPSVPFLLLASAKRWEDPFFTKAPGSSLTDKKSVVVYCCIVRLYPRKTAAGSSSGGNLRKMEWHSEQRCMKG